MKGLLHPIEQRRMGLPLIHKTTCSNLLSISPIFTLSSIRSSLSFCKNPFLQMGGKGKRKTKNRTGIAIRVKSLQADAQTPIRYEVLLKLKLSFNESQ